MKWGMFAAGLAAGAMLILLIQQFVLQPSISPVFSPDGGERILSLIDGAQNSLDIEVYVFTSKDVIQALERAKARGVGIRIIIERNVMGGQNDATYRRLASEGFNIRYARTDVALTHSKFIIVDGKWVLVGSHNFSNSALYENREASVIIRDVATVASFEDVFEEDWRVAN